MPWRMERRERATGRRRPGLPPSVRLGLIRRLRPVRTDGVSRRHAARARAADAVRNIRGNHGSTLRQGVPGLVTMFALACGLAALEAARVGAWDMALRFILLAAIADGVDGTLARRLRVTGPMGKQLDSLADVVAFGAAPAFLFAAYYEGGSDPLRLGAALAFVAAGVFRLARFNTRPGEGVFHGLPITAAGPLLAVVVAGPLALAPVAAAAIALALAALMVCGIPFPTLARWRWRLLPVLAAAALPVALWPRVETLAAVAATLFALYVAWGIAAWIHEHRSHGLEEEVPEGA